MRLEVFDRNRPGGDIGGAIWQDRRAPDIGQTANGMRGARCKPIRGVRECLTQRFLRMIGAVAMNQRGLR